MSLATVGFIQGLIMGKGQIVVVVPDTNFDKKISSQERGGGVRGVEQWIQMATDYKIVVVPDTGGTRCMVECPYNCCVQPVQVLLQNRPIVVVLFQAISCKRTSRSKYIHCTLVLFYMVCCCYESHLV